MLTYHDDPVLKHKLVAHLPLQLPFTLAWRQAHGLPLWLADLLVCARKDRAIDIDEVQRTLLLAIPVGRPLDVIPMPELLRTRIASTLTPRQCETLLDRIRRNLATTPSAPR